jgi:hypothetical protein
MWAGGVAATITLIKGRADKGFLYRFTKLT